MPNKLYSNNNASANLISNNNSSSSSSLANAANTAKAGKDQACKRVGSLKVDAKKVKSNVNRSKR